MPTCNMQIHAKRHVQEILHAQCFVNLWYINIKVRFNYVIYVIINVNSVGSAFDMQSRGPGFDPASGHGVNIK